VKVSDGDGVRMGERILEEKVSRQEGQSRRRDRGRDRRRDRGRDRDRDAKSEAI
jgi:hypothetical protein